MNNTAHIRCDVSSNLSNDQVLLVVWYKNNLPIYSYDTRGAHAGKPSHWRDEEILGERARFRSIRDPAELVIDPVEVSIFYITFLNIMFKFANLNIICL